MSVLRIVFISRLTNMKCLCKFSVEENIVMAATVHVLHPNSAPVAGFLRIVHTGQKKLEALLAAGRFPYRRVVFDAAHLGEQLVLLNALQASRCEVVLDPNFAEMATVGRFGGAVKQLPWAHPDRPWELEDFGPGQNRNLAKLIAEFAVQHGVSAVLSPTHVVDREDMRWRSIDLRFCEWLRDELDQAGGRHIAIDHQIISAMAAVGNPAIRQQISHDVQDLPVDNIWFRISGFGATATGAGTRHYIEVMRDFNAVGRPIVADFVGGFAGLAAAAFGSVGAISHGVGQKENFRANDWKSRPKGGGGQPRRAYFAELDRYFTENQTDQIFLTRHAKSRLGCNDTSCCHYGCDDMIDNGHAHFITQRSRQIDSLSGAPEARRVDHFLLNLLDPAVRTARFAARLKIQDESLRKLFDESKTRLIRVRDALADLHASESTATYLKPVPFRGGGGAINAVLGR
jgi:hypothetical protein